MPKTNCVTGENAGITAAAGLFPLHFCRPYDTVAEAYSNLMFLFWPSNIIVTVRVMVFIPSILKILKIIVTSIHHFKNNHLLYHKRTPKYPSFIQPPDYQGR